VAKKTEEVVSEEVHTANTCPGCSGLEVQDSSPVIDMLLRDLARLNGGLPEGIKSDVRPIKAIELALELIRVGTYSRRMW
jgi:hypothetical protein